MHNHCLLWLSSCGTSPARHSVERLIRNESKTARFIIITIIFTLPAQAGLWAA
jgi:hypothetical protein